MPKTEAKYYGSTLPACDFCKMAGVTPANPAAYDGKTRSGPWAYMCARHFKINGVGLGEGRGQKLVLVP